MALWQKWRFPNELRDQMVAAGFGRREKVLAWASTREGAVCALVGSLVMIEDGVVRAWAWHEIVRVRWSDDGCRLRWVTVAEPTVDVVAEFDTPGRLPEVIQERVDQSIVLHHQVTLRPGVVATVVARRGAQGDVEWSVHGPRLDALGLRSQAERELENIKQAWG